MIKINTQLSVTQAKSLICQMPMAKRIKLLQQLDKETWVQEMKTILKTIKQRRGMSKISAKEIADEIELGRQKFYARRL